MFSSSTSGISKMLLQPWISPSSNKLWRGRSSFFTIFPFAPGVKKQANINSTAKSEERNKDHCEYFSFQGIKKRYSKHFRKFDPNILREPIFKPGSHKDIKEASNASRYIFLCLKTSLTNQLSQKPVFVSRLSSLGTVKLT